MGKPFACRFAAVLFLCAGLLAFSAAACRRLSAAEPGAESLSDEEKQELRAAGSKLPPAELEAVIARLDAGRRQAWFYKTHPGDLRVELLSLAGQMRDADSPDKAEQFASARARFQEKVLWLRQNGVVISTEAANAAAVILLDVYAKREAAGSPPDYLPMDFAAGYADSPAAKSYLAAILRGADGPRRQAALIALAWSKNLKGDAEIYAVAADIQRRESANALALAVMSRLDRERALPVVLTLSDTTRDIALFNKASDILSEYDRADLLEHPLRRVNEFPKKPWGDLENPTLGIQPGLLLRYIAENEGEKLELGLNALEQSVEALLKSRPVIMDKLARGAPESRRAAAAFLQKTDGMEPFQNPQALKALEDRISQEPDGQTRRALSAAVSRFKAGAEGPRHE
ncbi:MAG: hypothetical protein PHP45_06105 [Elusimicrobiales bacterium]|nr:hypothetical protein [Elusimicrobiales bacterium]